MNFNEKQSQIIYEFVMRYNTEEEFRNNIQNLYDNETAELSILQIYALEEILRYGNSDIFNKFLETKGMYSEQEAVDLFDEFIHLLKTDENFKKYKMDTLKSSPETLSAMEIFAFKLISKSKKEKKKMYEEMKEELEYDPLNPILYSTDKQIKETLQNLFLGEFIHKMLELPGMKPIKIRQKESGIIANIDKPFIIGKVQEVISNQEAMNKFKQVIDNRYVSVKMHVLLGKGEAAFEEYLKYNTNISASEILGIEEDYSMKDMYDYFVKMYKNKEGRGPKK